MQELTYEQIGKLFDEKFDQKVGALEQRLEDRLHAVERQQRELELHLSRIETPSRAHGAGEPGRVGMYPGLQPFELDGASVAGGAFVPASYPKLR